MIKAVLFDMGGTLEDVYNNDETFRAGLDAACRILQSHGMAEGLTGASIYDAFSAGMDRYKAYTKQTNRELKPEEIWPDYYLKDLPFDKSGLNDDVCEELAHMWEDTNFSRALRPGVVEMLDGLKRLGLRLGVVSNNASLFQVFTVLENYGIRDYFEDVTVSSVVGYRKPHPHIFDVALRQFRMQEHPEECAYVGDTLSRDVIGPQQAGFGETFQIKSFLTASRDVDCVGKAHADHDIADISEVYTILKEELGR